MLETQQRTESHSTSFTVQAKILGLPNTKVQSGTPSSTGRGQSSVDPSIRKTRHSRRFISVKAPFQMLTGQVVSNFTESLGSSSNHKIRRSYQYAEIGSQRVTKNGEFTSSAPMMLLPKATVRRHTRFTDLCNELRDGSVIPLDPRGSLNLSTLTASTPVFHGRHGNGIIKWSKPFIISKSKQEENGSQFDTLANISKVADGNADLKLTPDLGIPLFENMSRPQSSDPFFISSKDYGPKSSHLESYADETRVTFRGPRRKTIGDIPLKDLPQNRDRRNSADFPVVTHLKGIAAFLGWFISRHGDRKELQHLPRNNYILRGQDPYFTNFVYKVQLHKRPDEDSSEDEDGNGRYTPRDGNKTRISYRRRKRLPSFLKLATGCSGAEGRPTSPNSQTDVTEDEPDFSVEVTNLIDAPSSPKSELTWKPLSRSPSVETPRKRVDSAAKSHRRRRGVVKKEKKRIDQSKPAKNKEDTEPEIKEPTEDETDKITEVDTPVSVPPPLPKALVVIPDLPKPRLVDKESKALKRQNRSRRSLIFNTNEPYIQPELLEQMETDRLKKDKDFQITGAESGDSFRFMSRHPIQLTQGRLALSQQSSRFELPMDMKILETLSPQDYVRQFCVVSSRRRLLYQKIFFKNKDKSGNIPLKDLERGLRDVLVGTLTKNNVQELCDWLEINEDSKIDINLFSGIAALAERVLYPQFVTGDTLDMPDFQREKIECADFGALSWKLNGVNVNPSVKNLLKMIS